MWQDGSEKEQLFCPPFSLGESCSPAPALMPDTSFPPCMLLVPFKLLPRCWSSQEVNLNKFMCGVFTRNCLRLQKFLSPAQSPLVFATRSCGDLSSWHWNPGLKGLVWGRTLHSQYFPAGFLSATHECGPASSKMLWFL